MNGRTHQELSGNSAAFWPSRRAARWTIFRSRSSSSIVPVIGVVLALLLVSCSSGEGDISRSSFSGEWPFTVSSGKILCDAKGDLLFDDGSTTYALNGTARQNGYPDVISSPDYKPGAYIGDVSAKASSLC